MMKDRIKSAIVMLGGLAVMLMLRHFWSFSFDLFWIMLTFLCTRELVLLVNRRENNAHCYKYVNYVYPIIIAVFALIGYLTNMQFHLIILYEMIILVLLMLGLIILPVLMPKFKKLPKEEKRNGREVIFNRALVSSYILIYPTLIMSCMLFVNHMVDLGVVEADVSNNIFGLFSILLILATSMATDTMAMFCGKLFKGKKLCPTISYNKRISGLIGGIAFAMIASVLMFLLFTLNADLLATFTAHNVKWWQFLIIGFFSGVVTSAGDLIGSYIKRRYFVKDFGNFFPGHGGFMDRLNGIILNIPVILISFIILF